MHVSLIRVKNFIKSSAFENFGPGKIKFKPNSKIREILNLNSYFFSFFHRITYYADISSH